MTHPNILQLNFYYEKNRVWAIIKRRKHKPSQHILRLNLEYLSLMFPTLHEVHGFDNYFLTLKLKKGN